MSTKTTLKRVALVAVSALGLGLVVTAPSSANTNTASYTESPAGTLTLVEGYVPATPVVFSAAGTIGSLTGAGPYLATITGMTGAYGLTPGDVITATAGTGSFGAGTMTVASVLSETSITVSSTATISAGTVTNISARALRAGSLSLALTDTAGVEDDDTMTLTIKPNSEADSEDVAFINALRAWVSQTALSGDKAVNDTTNGDIESVARAGNFLPGGTAEVITITFSPLADLFTTATGRIGLYLSALTAAAANGGKITYSITSVSGGGSVKASLDRSLTLALGATNVQGTSTWTPVAQAANIAAGGTASATVAVPFTASALASFAGPTFTLGGNVVNRDFNVTATATGGLVTVARTSGTTFETTILKDNSTGTVTPTFTITVTAPSTAQNGETITVSSSAGTYTATVFGGQTWNGTVTVTRTNGTGGAGAGWVGGNKQVYAPATVTATPTGDVANVRIETGIAASAPTLYPAWTFSMTGVGNFAVSGDGGATYGNRSSYVVVPATLVGDARVRIYADGRPGVGTLTVTAGGNTVATQVVNFYGPATKITVVPLYTVARAGDGATGYTLGSLDGVACAPVSFAPAICADWADALDDDKDVNDPALAVLVTDALGTPLPIAMGTGGVVMSSSNTAVVTNDFGGAASFLDAGVPLQTAGVLLNHITVKTAPSAKSGDSATLTFTHVNSLGATISATQKITVGGSKTGGKVTLSLDKSSYAPGERMVVTVKAVDASGNTVYDNATVGAFSSNKNVIGLAGTAGALYLDGSYVYGDDAGEDLFAPSTSGSFDLILASGTATGASVKVTATVGDDAATAAAAAAADAALEAIDAANAATDAANLAAEAADAATVAAEEARDAADAATAAVEALAAEVATLIAGLKAQITTLANTVAKIAKKVKA